MLIHQSLLAQHLGEILNFTLDTCSMAQGHLLISGQSSGGALE
jgi:hypothetical protein